MPLRAWTSFVTDDDAKYYADGKVTSLSRLSFVDEATARRGRFARELRAGSHGRQHRSRACVGAPWTPQPTVEWPPKGIMLGVGFGASAAKVTGQHERPQRGESGRLLFTSRSRAQRRLAALLRLHGSLSESGTLIVRPPHAECGQRRNLPLRECIMNLHNPARLPEPR